MFKTFLLALMVCLAPSQTNVVSLDDASVPVGMDEHCAPSDDFGYCHCTVRDVEGHVVETRWVRIDPSVHYCSDVESPNRGMDDASVDVTPSEVCDADGDVDGARACVEASVCDLTIKWTGVYPHPDEGKLQLSVSIATSKDRSDVSLGIFYKNTTEVPDWIKVDARHPLLVINSTKDHIRQDDLALYAFLGNCSDVLFFSFRSPNAYADWMDDHVGEASMIITRVCKVCNYINIVVCLVMIYKTCRTQRWRDMPLCGKVRAILFPMIRLGGAVIGLYLLSDA